VQRGAGIRCRVMDVVARCPYCGEPIDLEIDESGGREQHYIEDCSVCCQPIEVRVSIAGGRVGVDLRQSGD
jgi:Cysteine-rich CPXCG